LKAEAVSVPCPVIQDLYRSKIVPTSSGGTKPLRANIPPDYAEALYKTVLAERPMIAVEIGMACGVSSLAILAALRDAGMGGRLISIDPAQTTMFESTGLINVERAGHSSRHTLMEMKSYEALPKLLAESAGVQFVYIDGWHTFDYTLIDFFYSDKLLPVGGVVAFNDSGYRAIHKVLNYVRSHRHYTPMDVGLAPDYKARNPLFSVVKRIEGRSNSDRYFRKSDDWEPNWDFFARF